MTVPTMAIIGLIFFIINSTTILTKYDVVKNKSKTMAKYFKKYDLINENKEYDLLNSIINFITPNRFHYRKFECIPESLFFRVTIIFFLSFSSALFCVLAIRKIKKKKERLNKNELIINFLSFLCIGITIFDFLMLKDNIITSKEYLSIAVGIILGLLLAFSYKGDIRNIYERYYF